MVKPTDGARSRVRAATAVGVALSFLVPAACVLPGCPAPDQSNGLVLEVVNESDFGVRIQLEADGLPVVLFADARGGVRHVLKDCPDRVALREVLLDDAATDAQSLITGGELSAGTNYQCGDQIVVQISGEQAHLFTAPVP